MKATTLFPGCWIFAIGLLLISCSKDIDPIAEYPKNVSIKYLVSSTMQNVQADINHTNATGGDTEFENLNLPFNSTIQKSVDFGEVIKLIATSNNAENLILEIQINGMYMDSKTFESSSHNVGVLIYQFK